MNENERLREYQEKVSAARDKYNAEFSSFMERRRMNKKLDEGVREENNIRRKYHEVLEALALEYKDVIKPAQK